MTENETAMFVPVHDVAALRDKMRECIEGKQDLKRMSLCCQKHAEHIKKGTIVAAGAVL